MADQTLNQQTAISTANNGDFHYIVHNGQDYRITKQNYQKELQNQIDGLVSGFVGALAIADTPTQDGTYIASEEGTYTNAGGLVVSLTNQVCFISVTGGQTVFDLIEASIINEDYFVRASNFGMSTSNTGLQNAAILQTIVGLHNRVIIDNYYDLDISVSINVPADFEIKGLHRGDGFNLTASGTMFVGQNAGDRFVFSNLKINAPTAIASNPHRIFNLSLDDYYNLVEIGNCQSTGYVEAVYFIQTGEYDPTVTTHGIKKLHVHDNNITHQVGQFIYLRDIPTNEEIIENNTIINNAGVLFQSIMDTPRTYYDKIVEARPFQLVKNNTVYNEPSFNITEIDGGYVAIAVVESLNVEYINNHYEGVNHELDIATYDAYLSSSNVLYKDNIYKNNACLFATQLERNVLVKSKDNPLSTLTNPQRVYINNSWIIEDNWLSEIGKTSADCHHVLWEYCDDGTDFVFQDNYINIKGVRFESRRDLNSFNIQNNTMIFDYLQESSSMLTAYFNSQDAKDCVFSNNTIQYLTNPLSKISSIILSEFDGDWSKRITFTKNNIYCDNGSIEYVINTLDCDEFIFTDNNIITNYDTVFRTCGFKKSTIERNILRTNEAGNFFIGNAKGFIEEQGLVNQGNYNNGVTRIPIFINPTTSTTFKYSMIFEDDNGIDEISFEFTIYDDAGTKKITFTDNLDVVVDQVFNGINSFIKTTRTGTHDFGLTALYVKSATDPRIQISGEPTNVMYKTLKLKTF